MSPHHSSRSQVVKSNNGNLVKALPKSSRNTNYGQSVYEREQQYAAVSYGGSTAQTTTIVKGKTEFDILKENHRFIREDEEPDSVSWEERLARAYESKLFKEYALIDLKHYKSKRIALRWRTAEEVISSIGEETCSSLRCAYHNPISPSAQTQGVEMPRLQTFELPFQYEEVGERKEALVKVRLCGRCAGKLVYKPDSGKSVDKGKGKGKAVENEEDEVMYDSHKEAAPIEERRRIKSRRGNVDDELSDNEASGRRRTERTTRENVDASPSSGKRYSDRYQGRNRSQSPERDRRRRRE